MARDILVGAFVCLALILAPAAGAQAVREREYPIDVDKQPLTRALEQLSEQTGVSYGYIPETSAEEQELVGPVQGKYTIDRKIEALNAHVSQGTHDPETEKWVRQHAQEVGEAGGYAYAEAFRGFDFTER